MTEAQLQEAVRKLCRLLGVLAFHAHDSRRSWGPGFPDLVLAGPGGILFRELKSATGDTSAQQDLWGWTLCKAGADWAVWRPADLRERIPRELAAIR